MFSFKHVHRLPADVPVWLVWWLQQSHNWKVSMENMLQILCKCIVQRKHIREATCQIWMTEEYTLDHRLIRFLLLDWKYMNGKTKITTHYVIVLLIDGIIVKINFSPFSWGHLGTKDPCLKQHFAKHWIIKSFHRFYCDFLVFISCVYFPTPFSDVWGETGQEWTIR